jgi:hypothetical protein
MLAYVTRRVFSLPKKHGAHFDEKYLWDVIFSLSFPGQKPFAYRSAKCPGMARMSSGPMIMKAETAYIPNSCHTFSL